MQESLENAEIFNNREFVVDYVSGTKDEETEEDKYDLDLYVPTQTVKDIVNNYKVKISNILQDDFLKTILNEFTSILNEKDTLEVAYSIENFTVHHGDQELSSEIFQEGIRKLVELGEEAVHEHLYNHIKLYLEKYEELKGKGCLDRYKNIRYKVYSKIKESIEKGKFSVNPESEEAMYVTELTIFTK
ncbi:hypothetical protein [Neobacillus mesonae]|uniref:hypothetical protein n=1 Tax=Neobacillus mesonae TaxID=1193713 RepID=UPI00082B29B7|nr:hypothetical protein [Neobacillus mesonae]